MSDSGSLSDISISSQSHTKISDLGTGFQNTIMKSFKAIRKQNSDAKKAILKGKEHQSSTVAEHTEVVSVQLLNKDNDYLGSVHIDANGTVYPNNSWNKTLKKNQKKK